jgi:ABC-type multidrug transport system permease subunit
MKKIFAIALADMKFFLRDRVAIFWLFVAPFMFIFFTGLPGENRPTHTHEKDPVIHVVNRDTGTLGAMLVDFIGKGGFAMAGNPVDDPVEATVVIPADFTSSIAALEPVTVGLDIETSLDPAAELLIRGRLERRVWSFNAAVAGLLEEDVAVTSAVPFPPEALSTALEKPEPQYLDTSFSDIHPIPSGFDHAFPGNMVMFLLMNMLILSATGLSEERRNGILRRLGAFSISRWQILSGKILGRFLLGSVFIAVFLLAGQVGFQVPLTDRLPGIIGVLAAFCLFSCSLGVFLASVLNDPEKSVGICVFLAMVLSALGGCWWPLEIVPVWMQQLASFIPTGLTMEALHGLISFGNPSSEALVPAAVLLTLASIFAVLGYWKFRFY